ncbi:hypothetical protein V6Z12_A12G052400 [Gossypium hirsutum]
MYFCLFLTLLMPDCVLLHSLFFLHVEMAIIKYRFLIFDIENKRSPVAFMHPFVPS